MGVGRGAVTLIVNDLLQRQPDLRGRHRRDRARPQADVPLHRLPPPRRRRRRHPRQRDVRDARRPARQADRRRHVVRRPCAIRRRWSPTLAARIKALLAEHPEVDACEGIGVVVPGMVEHSTMTVLHAPTLGWRDVNLRDALAAATGLPVQIENSGRACALAQAWALRGGRARRRRRPGVRQRLGRRRRRRDHQRRGAARPAQHRRRVRPRAAVARRPALLVRRRTAAGKPTSRTARRWPATSAGRSTPRPARWTPPARTSPSTT